MDGAVLDRAPERIFGPARGEAWMRWQARKLDSRPPHAAALVVELRDPSSPGRAETAALVERCRRWNMAIYACSRATDDPSMPGRIASHLGLSHSLPCHGGKWEDIARVPWHSEGHGSPESSPVRASALHCLYAGAGGELALLDPELAWLLLRDQGKAFVRALMQADAFSIPHGAAGTHAVFTADASGDLHMRFSESRDAQRWKLDATVSEAAARLRRILDRDTPCVVRTHLEAGMGLVGNNVLVTRSMLLDTRTRVLPLAFRERVPGTQGAWRALVA